MESMEWYFTIFIILCSWIIYFNIKYLLAVVTGNQQPTLHCIKNINIFLGGGIYNISLVFSKGCIIFYDMYTWTSKKV